MNALLLAAGLGTRLKPITNKIPKPLVEIGGKPILEIWINKLFALGIKKILINTHYLPNQIENLVKNINRPKETEIKLVHEESLLGTAGTLIKNIDFFENKDCLFLHSDNFTTDNLKKFLNFNRLNTEWKIKMLTFETNNPSSCGIVKVNQSNIVTNFYEKDKTFRGNLANGAIYIIKNIVINELKNSKIKDFSTEVIPKYLNQILSYKTNNFFIDIGNIYSLNEANNYVLKNNEK